MKSEVQISEVTCPNHTTHKSENWLMIDFQAKPAYLQTHALNHYATLSQVDRKGLVIQIYLFTDGYRYFVCIYQESW